MKQLRKKYVSALIPTLCGLLILALSPTQTLGEEEQIVIEDLSPRQLRAQIKRIETEFYRVFNTNIDDQNLAVICYKHTPTGSNISVDLCEPQFLIDKRGANVNDLRSGNDVLLSPTDLRTALASEYEALIAAMTELSAENEYFRELNAILGALREELESR